MRKQDIMQLIDGCKRSGTTFAVDGDRLIVGGSKPTSEMVRRLSALLSADRTAVLAVVSADAPAAPVATMLWDLPALDAPAPAVSNPAYDAPVTAAMLSDADLDPQDPTMLAHYKHYVGKVVSDATITGLIHSANRYGFSITFEAQGAWRNACDYLVTSARFARNGKR